MKDETIPEYTAFEHEPILWHLLSTKRPNYSKGIQGVINHIINLAPAGSLVKTDKWGSLWIDTRTDKSRTMFAAHLDTVERKTWKERFPLKLRHPALSGRLTTMPLWVLMMGGAWL